MSLPNTRTEFKERCLRRLGKPVIEIDVEDQQIEDRIDEALKYYADVHYNGTQKIYYKHAITQEDKDNKYLTMPSNVNGAIRIFDIGNSIGATSGMFSIQYQIALNDLYSFSGMDLVPYWMMQENLQFIEQVLVGQKPIRYNRNDDRVYIDMNWDNLAVGQFIIVEAYQTMDPEDFPDVWSDKWLLKYATALIKRQWGANLSKFEGMQLPGGISFRGAAIFQEANDECHAMEQDIIDNSPLEFMMG
jgi:hypothetical protein